MQSASVLAILVFLLGLSDLSQAQSPTGTLSGKVMSPSGTAVPNAKLTIKNVATGQSTVAEADAEGRYNVPNLVPGDYEITAMAPGFSPHTEKATVTTATVSVDIALSAQPPGHQTAAPNNAPNAPNNLPNAPSSTTEPSLSDLGFSPSQVQGNPEEQARLDKRSHMLKTHQKLGLITTVPLIATVVTGFGAGGKRTSNTDRNVHAVLGSATAGLYLTTAYFAIFAPKVPGTPTRGPIRLHKALAWIHGPGMILTPILGAMAFNEKNKGEKVHGLASGHGPVAIVTAGAYGAALLAVSVKF